MDLVNQATERRYGLETLEDVTLVTEEKVWGGFDNDILFRLLITAIKSVERNESNAAVDESPPYTARHTFRCSCFEIR